MIKKTIKVFAYFLLANGLSINLNAKIKSDTDYTSFVNPFIGTLGTGHTSPGACVPFGNIQAGPETGNFDWSYTAGYQYKDKKITGFSQNRLNGTGIPDLGDLPIMPFSGDIVRADYSSTFDKKLETASPGYYSVELTDHAVKTEITAAAHTSLYKFTYNSDLAPHLLIDMQSNLCGTKNFSTHILSSKVNFESPTIISGSAQSNLWVNRNYYYVITFSKPYTTKTVLAKRASTEKADRYVFDFDLKKGEQLYVKIAISSVSIEGAKKNQLTEVPNWDFDLLRTSARSQWNNYLSRVKIEGTSDQMISFYTSMYHNFIQPNNIADVNESPFYSTFSLWDTYRASHPLYTLICPEKVNDFVNSFLKQYDKTGYLPIWTLWGIENRCMIANHSVPVLVDAYLKGFRGYDVNKAYSALKQSLTVNHPGSNWTAFDKYGYLPTDVVKNENVSTTLESAYDAYCAARFAKALHKTEDYNFFMKRAMSYKNLFDNESKLMRGKSTSGAWRTPFDKLSISHGGSAGGDYTEGNAWQYVWQVQHDVNGLIDLMGGKKAFINKLDTLFTMSSQVIAKGSSLDVSGLIGQYAHGNEPCHHVAYLYTLAGKREKTAAIVKQVCETQYLNKPDGLSGNDDCGQMSAWYIFATMGFYPVNPCGGEYVFGETQVDKVEMNLPNGKAFKVEKVYLANDKLPNYIELNGKKYDKNSISHSEILKGGSLKFYVHK
jgi:predicted alpha-1,2-mannosidase